MPQKRVFVEGGIYFVTVRTFKSRKIFINPEACRLFVEVLDFCHKKMQFELFGYVILTNHIHLLIRPDDKNDISKIMHSLKGNFAFKFLRQQRNHKGSVAADVQEIDVAADIQQCVSQIPPDIDHPGAADVQATDAGEPSWFTGQIKKRIRIRIYPVWQKSFHDRVVRSDKELYNKLRYIDFNPVKHGLVKDSIDWPFSSFHNHYQTGQNLIHLNYFE